MTDDNDRVLLTELCQRCYQPGALQPGFAFTPHAGIRPPPPDADLPACLAHIQALPAHDSAKVFGMHANADVAYQLQVYVKLVTVITIRSMLSHRIQVSASQLSSDRLALSIKSMVVEVLQEGVKLCQAFSLVLMLTELCFKQLSKGRHESKPFCSDRLALSIMMKLSVRCQVVASIQSGTDAE